METATLHIHICDQRRGYNVTFSTQTQAIEFLTRRMDGNHNFWETTGSVPGTWMKLIEFMHPQCEHGLSLDLCYGPNHYMSADQERAMGWGYVDAPSGF
jgi:hypothetical protein